MNEYDGAQGGSERQVGPNVAANGCAGRRPAGRRAELQALLGQDVRKVLITTIHKFAEAEKQIQAVSAGGRRQIGNAD